MKQTIFITTLCILFSFLINSCAVTEDITFKKNKEVEYNMTIDLSQLMALGGSGAPDGSTFTLSGFPELGNDSIRSLIDILGDSIDITNPEIMEDINNIKPLYMKIENDTENEKFALSVFGKFKNAEAFNKAFISFARLDEYQKSLKNEDSETDDSSVNNFSPNELFKNNSLYWDGKLMKRLTSQISDIEESGNPNEERFEEEGEDNIMNQLMGSMTNSLAPILNKTKITTNYYFEKKVKDTNRADATFSKDGKTVTISYTGEDSLNPEKNIPIEIKVK